MATSNDPTELALQPFVPGPALSIDTGAPPFQFGECLLARIPRKLDIDERIDDESVTPCSNLPPTSNGKSPQHFCFIRSIELAESGWILEVFPIVSFTNSGGALAGYNQMNDATKELLIPLPHSSTSLQYLTPALFGDPLTIGGCSTPRPLFLNIVPRKFVVNNTRKFKTTIPPASLSPEQLLRIDEYRNALRANREALQGTEQPQPPASGGSGGVDPRSGGFGQEGGQGSTEGGTGRVSNTDLVPTQPSAWDGGGSGRGRVVAKEDIAGIVTSDGILFAESVDEDADGDDCTWKDQLLMLAYDDPVWVFELQKYLQQEREEREKMQVDRMGRLTSWLQGMPLMV